MIDSGWLVVVGGQGATDGEPEVVGVPDSGGQREHSLCDARADSLRGSSLVALEVELSFEGGVHGLDDLSQWFEELRTWTGLFSFACLAEQVDTGLIESCLEHAAVVGLVGDHDLSTGSGQAGSGSQDRFEDLAFVGLSAGQRPPHGQTVQGADQMQPQTPEEPTVRGAVAVLGPSGQVGSLHGLPRAG